MIYASINDARADVPCISSQANAPSVSVGQLHFQQITPGNTGVGPDIPMLRSIDYPTQTSPTQCYVTSATMLKPGTTEEIPSACLWYNNNGGQNHNNKGIGFKSGSTKVGSFTIHKVAVATDIGPADISMFTNRVPFFLFSDNEWPLGQAVASAYERINDSPNLWMSSVLVYAEHDRNHTFNGKWDRTTVTYPTGNFQARIETQKTNNNTDLYVRIQTGRWYIVQFVVYGRSEGSYYVGQNIIATRGSGPVSTDNHDFTPRGNHLGTGLLPIYMSGINLTPFTTDTVTYSTTFRSTDNPQDGDLDPSFGCDDSFEFPPPPSEEDLEDEEDEFEDPDEDDDEDLELGPDDHYSDPPISRLVVRPEAQLMFEELSARFTEREARLAVNQLYPSDEYIEFTEMYHNALADGLSPRAARAYALGL